MFRATERQIAIKLKHANAALGNNRISIRPTNVGCPNYGAFDVLLDGKLISEKIPKIAVFSCLSGIIAALKI